MIKANELRIGNLIDNYHSPYSWESVDADMFSLVNEDGYLDGDPIPLTPEILEKCGFVKYNGPVIEGTEIWHKRYSYEDGTDIYGGIIIGYNNFTIRRYVYDNTYCMKDFIFSKLQYLHQLQNLYFALTGEELQSILELF